MIELDKYVLNTWKKTTLKKVYGSEAKQQLGELHKTLDHLPDIKRRKSECLGHGIRMDQQTTVAKIFFESKREGTRKIGKPGVK
jgi:hypothetical protein